MYLAILRFLCLAILFSCNHHLYLAILQFLYFAILTFSRNCEFISDNCSFFLNISPFWFLSYISRYFFNRNHKIVSFNSESFPYNWVYFTILAFYISKFRIFSHNCVYILQFWIFYLSQFWLFSHNRKFISDNCSFLYFFSKKCKNCKIKSLNYLFFCFFSEFLYTLSDTQTQETDAFIQFDIFI